MDFETAYQQAFDCEPSEQDCEIINRLMDKEYSDMGETITTAYLVGKIMRKGELNG